MKFIWQNRSFKVKIGFLISVLTVFIVFTCIRYNTLVDEVRDIGVEEATTRMLQGYKNELKDIVDVMALSLASAVKGVTEEEEVYTIFSKMIKDVRFFPDDSGYYFIYKTGGIVFAHAAQPHLEGRDLINFKDPKGKLLIQELDKVSRAGGGYVDYVWEKPKKGLKPKLSYSRMIPDTTYWIGTGVYIDDVQEQEEIVLQNIYTFTTNFSTKLYIVLGLCFLLIVVPLSWLVTRSIVKPVVELTNVADEFSRGNLHLTIPASEREDEIGMLARSIERLGASIKLAVGRLTKKERGAKASTKVTQSQSPFGLSRLFTQPKVIDRLKGRVELLRRENREKLGRLVLGLFDRWQLTIEEQLILLGYGTNDQLLLEDLRQGKRAPDSADTLDRIGWLLSIQQSMIAIHYDTAKKSIKWIRQPNSDFNDLSPLDLMKSHRMMGLIAVANHLDQKAEAGEQAEVS